MNLFIVESTNTKKFSYFSQNFKSINKMILGVQKEREKRENVLERAWGDYWGLGRSRKESWGLARMKDWLSCTFLSAHLWWSCKGTGCDFQKWVQGKQLQLGMAVHPGEAGPRGKTKI